MQGPKTQKEQVGSEAPPADRFKNAVLARNYAHAARGPAAQNAQRTKRKTL